MDYKTIEDKIIRTLRVDIPYIRTIEPYAGQFKHEIEKMHVRFPAAFVIYSGSTFEWIEGRNHKETVYFRVLVASRNLRGDAAKNKDGDVSGNVGAYRMVKDVLKALVNKDFDLDIEKLRPINISMVSEKGSFVVYGLDFQIVFSNAFGQ